MSQNKDYSSVLKQMCDETIQLLNRLNEIATVGLVVVREQRKIPGMANAQYCKYCTDLFVHHCGPDLVISKEEYASLTRSRKLLQALEAGGVDNWEQYHEATKEFYANEIEEI